MRAPAILRFAALAALVAVALPVPASAQIGGFIKKKVKEKVSGKPAEAAKAAPAGGSESIYSDNVLEITPALLDQLEKGLSAEDAARKESAARLATVKSEREYGRCQMNVASSPEGQKAHQQYMAEMQKGGAAGYQEAMQRMQARMDAIALATCGPNREQADSLRREARTAPIKAGVAASGLTSAQYSILRERITPFCSGQPEAGKGGQVRVKTQFKDMDYVYSASEVEALKARCARLTAALAGPESPGKKK